MNVVSLFEKLSRPDLAELYRYWSGDAAPSSADEDGLREATARLMADRERVLERFRALPSRCREILLHLLSRDGRRLAARTLVDRRAPDAAAKSFEIEQTLVALRKRGFVVEERDKSWVHYHEPVWRLPEPVSDALEAARTDGARTIETQVSLRAHLRSASPEGLRARLAQLGVDPEHARDLAAAARELASPARVASAIAQLTDPDLRDIVRRATDEHGGLLDRGFLERIEAPLDRAPAWRRELEELLLGTIYEGDLGDVGILFKSGSLCLFYEIVRGARERDLELDVDEPPEPPGDVLGDLGRVRDFLDHHSLRVTRDGQLYRATARKMETEVLSAGSRPAPPETVLEFLLEFLMAHDLVRADDDQRLRPKPAWRSFEEKSPVERGEMLLKFAQEDLRGARAEFHHARLRRIALQLLREAGPGRWVDARRLAHAARNHYLATLDQKATAERFQRRYQYAPIPPLEPPAIMTREMIRFVSVSLGLAGLVESHLPEEGPQAVRLTKLGAAVLGVTAEDEDGAVDAGFIVTADFEIVVFPDGAPLEALQIINRFARREKADVTLHYRIAERSVQEAVAAGASIDQFLDLLKRLSRYEPPQNVVASCEAWAKAVTVLESRRALLLRAPSKEALDEALKVRELKSISGERLNDLTLEVTEDPTALRIAEALRAQGFYLR